MNIEAQSEIELAQKLAETDISVLPKRSGRTNDQVERWVMYRALATLLSNDLIEYPINLMKRERPDFLLDCGGKQIGCEVTQAVNEEYLKAQTLPEASSENSVVDVSKFKWGAPKRSLEKLREIASKEKLTGPGWAGNSVEREYAQIVYDVALVKTEKMKKLGYERFASNYLLIYCNQSLPILNISEGAAICHEALNNYWSTDSFDSILVEKGENIVMFSPSSHQILLLNNLWANG